MELSDEGATLVLMMHDTGGEELYVLVSIYDIVCCVLALMLEQGLFRNQALTNEKNFLTQLVHMQEEQYRTSKANVEMVNIKCHDMKHQISHITSTTDPDAIRELEQIISVYDSSLQTGNEILDVCLMEKKLAEPHERWCGRTGGSHPLLPDCRLFHNGNGLRQCANRQGVFAGLVDGQFHFNHAPVSAVDCHDLFRDDFAVADCLHGRNAVVAVVPQQDIRRERHASLGFHNGFIRGHWK